MRRRSTTVASPVAARGAVVRDPGADQPADQPADRPSEQPAEQPAEHRAGLVAAALRSAAAPGLRAHDLADRLCAAAVQAVGARGATLCAQFAVGMSVPVGVSDPVAARAEELQFSAGEGPCWEAYEDGRVVVADLRDTAGAARRWPVYALSLRREVDYDAVVAVPVRLASGLDVVLTVYGPALEADRWWSAAAVVADALREVLDAASPPMTGGGPVWLDSSSTLRRGTVWVAEAVLVDHDPSLTPARALVALRTYSTFEGTTVDAVAAALVQGRVSARQVLGRPG